MDGLWCSLYYMDQWKPGDAKGVCYLTVNCRETGSFLHDNRRLTKFHDRHSPRPGTYYYTLFKGTLIF